MRRSDPARPTPCARASGRARCRDDRRLVIGLLALNRDVEAVARATPKDGSVGPAAIQDDGVTGSKLAPGAVGSGQIADGAAVAAKVGPAAVGPDAIAPGAVATKHLVPGAVSSPQLAAGAVTSAHVATNALVGADIDEGTIGRVRRTTRADSADTAIRATRADTAASAGSLDGLTRTAVLSNVTLVDTATRATWTSLKGPVTARCPDGARIGGGGAASEGSTTGVAITRSGPASATAWVAAAEEVGVVSAPWRLVVTATCADGGD